ncbi:MAG: bifunctional glycosyltransferase family 2/GtrA family protein [Atopobiaceae bacterium]|nr:bifunctional glycosyltransferase family 2/GtrA family protein [Atopobiaceae bacterium]
MKARTVAIIPAYEPQPGLVDIVDALDSKGFEVVVVDDGSSDQAAGVFEAICQRATLLSHATNSGKGEAIKTGLAHALSTYGTACTIVTVDADGQHAIDDVVRVCEEARTHPTSLVLGSRTFDGDVPLRSRLGNAVTCGVFRLTSGASVRDTQTGLRAFSGELARTLAAVEGTRYEYEMNVLMQCARAGIELREVEIQTIYLNGNESSHFHPVRDSVRIYGKILKFSASSLLSFVIDYVLFCVLLSATETAVFANVAARLVSATANYAMNRHIVFASKEPVTRSLPHYVLLAACMLACNTIVLNALVVMGAPALVAKVAVEVASFFVSYHVQHSFVFNERSNNYEEAYVGNRL